MIKIDGCKDLKVGVILVNYNGKNYNEECIDSILKSTYKNLEVLVVDNASSDDSVELLKKRYMNNITVVETGLNLGFSGGNNVGIKLALEKKCDFILLLNNDTVIEEKMIEIMVETSIDNQYCVISPKIYYYDNKEVIWSAGADMIWKKGIPAQRGMNEVDKGQFDIECNVEIATGCCLLIHKKIVEEVGLLPDDYFLYYEDTDYTTQIVRRGYKILYLPSARMYHKVSASTGGEESFNYIYYNTRNRLLFNKRFNYKNKTSYITYFYATRVIKIIKWFIMKRNDLIKATLKGIKDFNNNKLGTL